MSLVAVVLLIFLVSPILANPVGFPSADLNFNGYNGPYNNPFGYFPGYPKTVDMAKENFVRGSEYGPTEVGTRNELTIRPTGLFPRHYHNHHFHNHYCHNNYYPNQWCHNNYHHNHCRCNNYYPNQWCCHHHFPSHCCIYPFYMLPVCRNYHHYGNVRSNPLSYLARSASTMET